MKVTQRNQQIDFATANQALSNYINSFEGRSAFTLRLYRFTIHRFLKFSQRCVERINGSVVVDEDRVLRWMLRESRDVTAKCAASKFRILSRFLSALRRAGLIASDPTADLRARFGKRGWTGIALALKSIDHKGALEAVRTEPRFTSPLGEPMRAYLLSTTTTLPWGRVASVRSVSRWRNRTRWPVSSDSYSFFSIPGSSSSTRWAIYP